MRSVFPSLAWLLLAVSSVAEEAPRITRLNRHAVPRNSHRDVTLYGHNLRNALAVRDDVSPLRVKEIPGDPRDNPQRLAMQVEVGAETPLGYYGFRVVNEHGISNPMVLLVDDLPTVYESAAHDRPDRAQRITWPSAVEGSISQDQSDFYRIHANRGDRLSVEAVAQRLGSPFDPLICLTDEDGQELAWSDDEPALGADAHFAYRFTESGDYLLEICDSQYQGGDEYHYRLRLGSFPLVTACYPLAGQAGKEVQVELVGPSVEGVPRQSIRMPSPGAGDEAIQQSASRAAGGGSAFFRIYKSNDDEWLEAEPNDLPDQPQKVALHAGINGRIDRPGDRDQYIFEASAGENLWLHSMSHTLGSPVELAMRLYDSAGKQIAQSADEGDEEQSLWVRIPATGRYRLQVEEAASRGGADYVYRIALATTNPDYVVSAEAAVFALPRDGVLTVPVKVQRHFGFQGPIHFHLAGTVDGWKVLDSIGADMSEARIRIELPDGLWSGFSNGFYLSAWAKIDGDTENWGVSHRTAVQREFHAMRIVPENLLGSMEVAVIPALPPAFELSVERPELPIEPLGKPAALKVTARRLGKFNGPIELRVRGLPEECEVRDAVIAKGQESATVTVKLTEDTVPGSPQFEVLGLAEHEGQGRKVLVSKLKLEIVRPH